MSRHQTLLGKVITKRFPPRGDLQLVRLEAAVSFTCSACTQTRKAGLVAVRGNDLLCNGCYGQAVATVEESDSTPPQRSDQPRATSASPSGSPTGGLPARKTEDLEGAVVKEPDGGLPYSVLNTGPALKWEFKVRAEHLLRGTSPVPAGMASRAASPVFLTVVTWVRGRHRVEKLDEQQNVKLRLDGDVPLLEGLSWQPFVLPGTHVSARWDRWRKIRLVYTRLDQPVLFAGVVVRYVYDPRIMTRDLATFDMRVDRVEELVLMTLRELGYLDEHGRALLPHEALVQNTIKRGQPKRPPSRKVHEAIKRLLSRKILTWKRGSLTQNGLVQFPASHGERPIRLLCYAPTLRIAEPEDLRVEDEHYAESANVHRVAGHLMRIGHLGKEASAEARAAYRHDHEKAGLAGPHDLPRDYTYVQEHKRGI